MQRFLISGSTIRNIILGAQDGLVNVLGLVLGVAGAGLNSKTIIITGLVATAAESVSMAAVAYTSTKAAREYYDARKKDESRQMRVLPEEEAKEVRDIYVAKGFRGQLLSQIVAHITSRPRIWRDTMMLEELGLNRTDYASPSADAVVVGLASVVGSLIPLLGFVILTDTNAVRISVVLSALALFAIGFAKARLTTGSPWRSGVELAGIGLLAAIVGWGVGRVIGVTS